MASVSTPHVPVSLQKQPQTVYERTGVACPTKLFTETGDCTGPGGGEPLPAAIVSVHSDGQTATGLPGALSHWDSAARSTDRQRATPVEGLCGPFPDGSASAVIFICLKTQAREY